MDVVQVSGCFQGQLVETVKLETGKNNGSDVICTCKMGYEDMYVILCCTKIKYVNKIHHFRAVSCRFLSYVCYCLVVTMYQDLFAWPLVTQVFMAEAMTNSSFQVTFLSVCMIRQPLDWDPVF